MAAWEAIVIGLGSGIASGLLGTLATLSHERRAEFRTRMIGAAEELVAAAATAMLAGRDVVVEISTIEHHEGDGAADGVPSVDELMRTFNTAVDVVSVRVMRVSLLFGIDAAAISATEFGPIFVEMRKILWRKADRRAEVDFDRCFQQVIDASRIFIDDARGEIARSPWKRLAT